MKKLLIAVIITAFVVGGCSLQDSMAKATSYIQKGSKIYNNVITDIRETVGDETIEQLLSLYDDERVAEELILFYEDKVGEEFGPNERDLLRTMLTFMLKQIRKDLTKAEAVLI